MFNVVDVSPYGLLSSFFPRCAAGFVIPEAAYTYANSGSLGLAVIGHVPPSGTGYQLCIMGQGAGEYTFPQDSIGVYIPAGIAPYFRTTFNFWLGSSKKALALAFQVASTDTEEIILVEDATSTHSHATVASDWAARSIGLYLTPVGGSTRLRMRVSHATQGIGTNYYTELVPDGDAPLEPGVVHSVYVQYATSLGPRLWLDGVLQADNVLEAAHSADGWTSGAGGNAATWLPASRIHGTASQWVMHGGTVEGSARLYYIQTYMDTPDPLPTDEQLADLIQDPLLPGRGSFFLSKYPMVGQPTPHSVKINMPVCSDLTLHVRVRCSRSSSNLSEAPILFDSEGPASEYSTNVSSAVNALNVELSGLLPLTQYYYRYEYTMDEGASWDYLLNADGGDYFSFYTAPLDNQAFNVVVQTDAHVFNMTNSLMPFGVIAISNFTVQSQRNSAAMRDYGHVLLDIGDTFLATGTGAASYLTGDSLGVAAYARMRNDYIYPLLERLPIYHTVGNHEEVRGCLSPVLLAAGINAHRAATVNPETGDPDGIYYRARYGCAEFFGLNPFTFTTTIHNTAPAGGGGYPWDWTFGDVQLAWLEEALRTSTARWKICLSHHMVGGIQRMVSGSLANAYGRGCSETVKYARTEMANVVHPMMVKYGVDMYLMGHDHLFHHGTVDGVEYAVVSSPSVVFSAAGPGGALSKSGDPEYNGPTTKFVSGKRGFAQLQIDPSTLRLIFLPVPSPITGTISGPLYTYDISSPASFSNPTVVIQSLQSSALPIPWYTRLKGDQMTLRARQSISLKEPDFRSSQLDASRIPDLLADVSAGKVELTFAPSIPTTYLRRALVAYGRLDDYDSLAALDSVQSALAQGKFSRLVRILRVELGL